MKCKNLNFSRQVFVYTYPRFFLCRTVADDKVYAKMYYNVNCYCLLRPDVLRLEYSSDG